VPKHYRLEPPYCAAPDGICLHGGSLFLRRGLDSADSLPFLADYGRPNRLLSTPAAKSSWHGLKYRVQVEVFSQNLVMPGLALAEKLALVMFRNLVRS
jgi:hypothetical protein